MMKRMKPGILALVLMSVIYSCTHKSSDIQPTTPPGGGTGTGSGTGGTGGGTGTGGAGTGGGTTTPPDTALCFERDILPIFISNCAKSGCHDAASAQDGYVFTSYQTITAKKFRAGDPGETELYEKITEHDSRKIMPPPPNAPLTSDQISKIGRWITMGAPKTTGCSTGNCDSTKFAFSETIQPILNTNCKGCHNSASASGGVNLDNYNGVKIVASDGRLLGVTKQLSGYPAMPRGGTKLSDCQIMKLEKWIAAGVPNN
jgi:hypothetical protein